MYEQKTLEDYGLKFESKLELDDFDFEKPRWRFITDPERIEKEAKRLQELERKGELSLRVSPETWNRRIGGPGSCYPLGHIDLELAFKDY